MGRSTRTAMTCTVLGPCCPLGSWARTSTDGSLCSSSGLRILSRICYLIHGPWPQQYPTSPFTLGHSTQTLLFFLLVSLRSAWSVHRCGIRSLQPTRVLCSLTTMPMSVAWAMVVHSSWGGQSLGTHSTKLCQTVPKSMGHAGLNVTSGWATKMMSLYQMGTTTASSVL